MNDWQEAMNSNQAIKEALAAIEEKMRRLSVARVSLMNLLEDDDSEMAQTNLHPAPHSAVEYWRQHGKEASPAKVNELDQEIEKHFKGKELWTVMQVSMALQLNADHRGAIWNAINRLVEAGKVKVVEAGAGRRPSVYSWMGLPVEDI